MLKHCKITETRKGAFLAASLMAAVASTALMSSSAQAAGAPTGSVQINADIGLLGFEAGPGGNGHGHGNHANNYRITWDDFDDGFSADSADSKWFYFSAGPFVGNDGIETTSNKGLSVVASGVKPDTGKPAFTLGLGQEDENGGLPGGLDHVKWLVFANHLATSGYPGFDAVPGRELACETWVKARTYGNEGHPFGDEVINANDDLRLSAIGVNSIDFESFMVFDFFITNETIYAMYERLPFGRPALGNYAAFTFNIPLASTSPGEQHRYKIAYDKAEGTVRWIVDGDELFSIDQIGHLIDRDYLTIDHGGVEQDVSPNQLDCGMGMFTLLDAHQPSGTGLVRLSNADDFYFDPEVGEPVDQTFLDDESLEENRLFGQGAEIKVKKYVVSSKPSH